jgi:molecular chaperone GrpE
VTDQANTPEAAEEVVGSEEFEPTTAEAAAPDPSAASAETAAGATKDADASGRHTATSAETAAGATKDADASEVLAAERLADLQRLQAEYVNYKRRVDRDRAVVQERAVHSVLEAVLPVLDDIHAAREHGDLADGPFAAIADKLEGTLGKFGLERYGTPGEEFDPNLHEALMHTAWPTDGSLGTPESTTVVQVLQPGYRAGDQVLRAARVAVADPE